MDDMDVRDPELIDYLRVVWRWKWVIVMCTVLGALPPVIRDRFTSPVYEAEAQFKIGRSMSVTGGEIVPALVESYEDVVAALGGRPLFEQAARRAGIDPAAERIVIRVKERPAPGPSAAGRAGEGESRTLVAYTTRAASPGKAAALAMAVGEVLAARHHDAIDIARRLLAEQASDLRGELDQARRDAESRRELLEEIVLYEEEPEALFQDLAGAHLIESDQDILPLMEALHRIQAVERVVLEESRLVACSDPPAAPLRALVVVDSVLCAIAGLFFGLVVAFASNYFRRARGRRR